MKEGIHVMHLFYRVDRMAWAELEPAGSAKTREKLEALCEANNNASHPLIGSYANVGGEGGLGVHVVSRGLLRPRSTAS